MGKNKWVWKFINYSILIVTLFFVLSNSVNASSLRTDALILVNSTSDDFNDFNIYIKPYLDNFGVPYTVRDISSTPLGTDIGEFPIIIIGHRQLDPNHLYLDATEQVNLSNAVQGGTGLVNFDNYLFNGVTPVYQFIQDVFGFSYTSASTEYSVSFPNILHQLNIDCWDDSHQNPIYPTVTSSSYLNPSDGEWTEFHYVAGGRPYPSVMAAAGEINYGLPVMRFYTTDIPNGNYEVFAKLYTSGPGRNMRYFYGFSPTNPYEFSVDTVGGTGGSEQHTEYKLGNVSINDGNFNLYVQDAQIIQGTSSYPWFGWAQIRLVPINGTSAMHYISDNHPLNETIITGGMRLPGILLPPHVTAPVIAGSQPLISVTTHYNGRAVQWGSYDWISLSVKGPVYGLDDLVWKSIVWAARKPFVMKGLPNFFTMRVDDESGTALWWADIASQFGIKPWMGLFFYNFNDVTANHLSSLVNEGKATASIHAFNNDNFFYFDHYSGTELPDSVMAERMEEGSRWHSNHNIPISKFVLPHYYEFSTNSFTGLKNWGVEFVGTQMAPGTPYDSPWLVEGPYRLYEPQQSSRNTLPGTYSDILVIPRHPELNSKFFNCVSEIRDDAGYEWFPEDSDVPGTIGRGTRQLKRSFDSMVLATLFTHSQRISGDDGYLPITPENWRAILQGITSNLAPYNPIYTTMDNACQYIRAIKSSSITNSTFDPDIGILSLMVSGKSDVNTQYYLFDEGNNIITKNFIDIPAFTGLINVTKQLGISLLPNYFVISPINGAVTAGTAFGITVTAYDQLGSVLTTYTGQAALSDTTGTIIPVTTGYFVNGVWTGNVTIGQAATGVTITARNGTAIGSSPFFDVINPIPASTILSPSTASVGGAAFTLTEDGTGFVSGSIVRWNGVDRTTTYVSGTRLTASIPASDIAGAGTALVTVFNPAPGGGISNSLAFTINNPTPALTGLSPSSATSGDGAFTLTLNGTGFVTNSVVRWNGSNRTTTFVSVTQLTAAIPASDIAVGGTAQVTVLNPAPGGGISNSLAFTINNPLPALTVLSPSTRTAGSTGFTLTVNGTGFVTNSVVRWNGSNRTTTFISATQLTAAISASDIAVGGTAQVTEFNPAPGGGTSNSLAFTINNPIPVLTSLSPATRTARSSGFTLTVNGTGFVTNSVVQWNGSNRTTTFVSATRLTASITASNIALAGTVPITVFTPTPGGGTSNSLVLTINDPPAPTITSLSPSTRTARGSAFTLTVNGTGFVTNSVVQWNGSNRTTTFVSATRLTASIPASDIAVAGTFPVTVFTPAPGGGTSNPLNVVVNNPVPVLTSRSPSSAIAGGGAFTLTVNGSGYVPGSVVRWNGSDRPTTFVSSTRLTAAIPASDIAVAGTAQVTVFNSSPGGGVSTARTFTIQ